MYIIDCTEVFIERPSDLLACAQVWSNYTHHSTVKFLTGIAPQGSSTSDKKITEQSGIMDLFLPDNYIIPLTWY